MRKNISILILLPFILLLLSSCSFITKFDKCHPTNQPMSKWVGSCNDIQFELYIADSDSDSEDIMIIDYGNKKLSYIVWWHGNYLSQMSINDVRVVYQQISDNSVHKTHLNIGYWNIELVSQTCFKLIYYGVGRRGGVSEIPELMLPEEVVMTRVATGLTEPIPQIEPDENYGYCPAYRQGTKWVSDDNQISIDMVNCGEGRVVFADDPNLQYYIGFFESNSKAYSVKDQEDHYDILRYSFATEEWRCEYFEKYFTAEVVRSEHYETGHILTFNIIE